MKKPPIVICADHASPPTDEHECREAIWSQGRACKSCPRDDCYRQGWSARQVTIDNAALVKRTLAAYQKAKRAEALDGDPREGGAE